MPTTLENHSFQAEVRELLGLVIHSLYKEREIFLRELVSNASDALDKLRLEALGNPALPSPEGGAIRLVVDREARTLAIEDDGIGMDHDELVSNLGTIARSGTRAFLEKLAAEKSERAALIGQFGVGFYASFMVADRVTVDTRRAGSEQGWRWESDGQGGYTIEPRPRATHGTRVTLHLRAHAAESHSADHSADAESDGNDDPSEFLETYRLRSIVRKYSDFVGWPVQMEMPDAQDTAAREGATKLETLNSMRPLWTRPKDEIQRSEYDEFYRRTTHDFDPPSEIIHFKAEGATEYTALLFLPARRPIDLFDGTQGRSRLALYVKHVLIMPECADLLPSWMRFVRGLVDAPDLPLNVSRDVLQSNHKIRAIHKRLVKRVVEALASMLEKRREDYLGFWNGFGVLLKEGIYAGEDEDSRLAKLTLWPSTHGAALTTLGEYVARMKPDQKAIWYLAGDERATLEGSPHVEALKRRGEEVLFFLDPIDEWVIQRLREFDGKRLEAIDRDSALHETTSEKEARETLDRDHREFLQWFESRLAEDVKSVRFTTRLCDSPAVLVNDAHAVSANMERILRAANQEVKREKRVLELNADHALIRRLCQWQVEAPTAERTADLAELVYSQALLAEGSSLANPVRFAKLMTKFLLG